MEEKRLVLMEVSTLNTLRTGRVRSKFENVLTNVLGLSKENQRVQGFEYVEYVQIRIYPYIYREKNKMREIGVTGARARKVYKMDVLNVLNVLTIGKSTV